MSEILDKLYLQITKGNFFIAAFIVFFLAVIPLTGYNTIRTILFENYRDNLIQYEECIAWDYTEQGNICEESIYKYATFDSRIKSHFNNAILYGVMAIAIIFYINALPKIKKYNNRNKLSQSDFKKLIIKKDIEHVVDEYISYKFEITNNSEYTIKSVLIKFHYGLYYEYNVNQFEDKIMKTGENKHEILIIPNKLGIVSGSFYIGRKEYISKKLIDEGWREGVYDVWVDYVEI